MANLEKFFCIFALLIASLMSLLLCLVLSTVPVICDVGPNGAPQATAQPDEPGGTLQQREPNLDPRTPSDSFMSPTPGE